MKEKMKVWFSNHAIEIFAAFGLFTAGIAIGFTKGSQVKQNYINDAIMASLRVGSDETIMMIKEKIADGGEVKIIDSYGRSAVIKGTETKTDD